MTALMDSIWHWLELSLAVLGAVSIVMFVIGLMFPQDGNYD